MIQFSSRIILVFCLLVVMGLTSTPRQAFAVTSLPAEVSSVVSAEHENQTPLVSPRSWAGIAIGTLVSILIVVFAPQLTPWFGVVLTLAIGIADQLIDDYKAGRLQAAWNKVRSRLPGWLRWKT